LKAGLYRLSPRSSLWDVVTTLSEGKTELLTLRVPEGYTAEQIAEELEKMKVVTVAQFLQAARDPAVLKELDIPGPDAEGFLFPQTYRVPLGADAQALIELMVRQFRDSVGPDFDEKCKKRDLTPYRAVILASIVEKEAQKAEERPVIAGILYNRLHKKMRLEVNATLNYVLADKRAWLTDAQLSTRSPYNTYLHRGLPPTPICNPGLASLQAVLEPADVPYLYFVAQGDGSHLFASTFEEHKKNIRAAKRIQRARRSDAAPAR
jgi:peptidoglycan lytic transglycosylase G